jgi:hypothetical protein
MHGLSAMAFPNSMFGRPSRAASAVRLHRQTASQIRAGNDATFYRPPPDTHAGTVRTHELPCGDRHAGTSVVIPVKINFTRRHPVRGVCGISRADEYSSYDLFIRFNTFSSVKMSRLNLLRGRLLSLLLSISVPNMQLKASS